MANKKEIISEETEVVKETKKAPRKYAPDDMITCRSVTFGELLMTGKKSIISYYYRKANRFCQF